MRGFVGRLTGMLVAASLLVSCSAGAVAPEVAPTDGASTASSPPQASPLPAPSPSSVAGASPAAVGAALSEVEDGQAPLTSLAVVHHDELLGEAHGPGLDAGTPQPVWSVTKSVVSALVGIAVEEGLLTLDTTLPELFGDAAGAHPGVTVEDLLTMRSGLDLADSEAGLRALYATDDWVQAILERPAAHPPGETFAYCSACVHLLTAALHQATGDLLGWADERLFAPLGIGEVTWELAADGSQVPVGGWGLEMTVSQMVELGRLYLAGGSWEGTQVVPAAWVEASVEPHAAAGGPFDAAQVGYGYLWWVQESGYAATGRGGQLIVVVPRSDLVVAATADLSDEEAFRAFAFVWTRIVAAVPLG